MGGNRTIDGSDLCRMFQNAAGLFENHAENINSINVFPVPDGDTGTNLQMTLLAATREAAESSDGNAGLVAAALARGALKGATGNAGVLLAQFLLGLAKGLEGAQSVDTRTLSTALTTAHEFVSRSLSDPVEGTILTLTRDVSRAAQGDSAAAMGLTDFFRFIVDTAEASVRRTPELLPILKKSGCVDAGAVGFHLILQGLAQSLDGVDSHWFDIERANPGAIARMDKLPEQTYGYCTEFIIKSASISIDRLRSELGGKGGSLIVAGNNREARVHIHTADPGMVLHLATGHGVLDKISIRNMDVQHQDFLESRKTGTRTLGIVTDSVSDLPPEVVRRLGISVVPLIVRFGTQALRDGIDMSVEEFYQRLAEGGSFPTTSVPSPQSYADTYDLLAEETDTILVLTLSSRLSGAYNVAAQAVDLMKKKCRVEVFDTGWAAMAEGFLAMKAAEAANSGSGVDQVLNVLKHTLERIDFLATFDTLEYLRRGGRIGPATARAGDVLKINPLIHLKNGKVSPAGAAVSRRRAINKLYRFAARFKNVEKIGIENGACQSDADALEEALKKVHPHAEFYSSRVTPVMGSHTGPGLLVVTVLGDKS